MGDEDHGQKTTIRITEADRKILQKLRGYTGLKNAQLIRAGLRTLLRVIEGGLGNAKK